MKRLILALAIVATCLQTDASNKSQIIKDNTPYNAQTSGVEKLPQDLQKNILSFLTVLPIKYVQSNIRLYCRANQLANTLVLNDFYDEQLPLEKIVRDLNFKKYTKIKNIKKLLTAGADPQAPFKTFGCSYFNNPFELVQDLIQDKKCHPKTRKEYAKILKTFNTDSQTNLALCPQRSYAYMVQEHKSWYGDGNNPFDYDESSPYETIRKNNKRQREN